MRMRDIPKSDDARCMQEVGTQRRRSTRTTYYGAIINHVHDRVPSGGCSTCCVCLVTCLVSGRCDAARRELALPVFVLNVENVTRNEKERIGGESGGEGLRLVEKAK